MNWYWCWCFYFAENIKHLRCQTKNKGNSSKLIHWICWKLNHITTVLCCKKCIFFFAIFFCKLNFCDKCVPVVERFIFYGSTPFYKAVYLKKTFLNSIHVVWWDYIMIFPHKKNLVFRSLFIKTVRGIEVWCITSHNEALYTKKSLFLLMNKNFPLEEDRFEKFFKIFLLIKISLKFSLEYSLIASCVEKREQKHICNDTENQTNCLHRKQQQQQQKINNKIKNKNFWLLDSSTKFTGYYVLLRQKKNFKWQQKAQVTFTLKDFCLLVVLATWNEKSPMGCESFPCHTKNNENL